MNFFKSAPVATGRRRLWRCLPWVACALVLVWAPPVAQARPRELTVAAASSLQPAMKELGRVFRRRAGVEPVFVFASSGVLARQIEYGAPYDLFLSADEIWVAYLARKELVGRGWVYAEGGLALALRPGLVFARRDPLDAAALARVLGGIRIRYFALANPAHAPYGVAARQALRRAGLLEPMRERLVFGENVRQALSFVESGNADAGLVAQGLAATTALPWRPVKRSLHRPIRQALAIPIHSGSRAAAADFVELLFSRQGAEVLGRHGFVPLPRPPAGAPP
ncbi:MAG: molybdate ABC transporter substrate-binding protein [bacterium]